MNAKSTVYCTLMISILLLCVLVLVRQPARKVFGLTGYRSNTDRVSTVIPGAESGLALLSVIGGGEYIAAVDVSGAYAYVGDATGLSVLDVSVPTTPTLYARQVLTDIVTSVQIIGSLAYVANWSGGLKIYDVSDAVNLRLIGGYQTPGPAADVEVIGDLAYIAYGFGGNPSGIAIVNVTNPAAPAVLSIYETSGAAQGLDVIGNTAYIAASEQGLVILDVTNPLSPTLTGNYDTPGYAEDVSIAGGLAYVADAGVGGLQIIDVTTPTTPSLVSSYPTLYYALKVAAIGGLAYVLDSGEGGLQIIDVTTPVSPTLLGVYAMFNPVSVQIMGGQAFVAGGNDGLSILNVNNPDSLIRTGHYRPPMYTSAQVSDQILYAAAGAQGVQVIDVSEPGSPLVHTTYPYPTNGVVIADQQAYLSGIDGFQILDVRQPLTPTLLGGYSAQTGMSVKEVISSLAYGVYIYPSSEFLQSNELWIFDVSNPAHPILISDSYLGDNYMGRSTDVEVRDDLAYVPLQDNLLIVDISQPATPKFLAEYVQYGLGTGDIALADNFLYAALGNAGLEVIDVSNPQAPIHSRSYADAAVYKLQVVDNLIFAAASNLLVLESDSLSVVGNYPLPSSTYDMQVVGNLVYVANRGGLFILRSTITANRSFLPLVQR